MLPVGALCFCQKNFGRTVLPKWPLWAHLFYSVCFYSVSELRSACFRQARVARAVLLASALFRAAAFAFPPCTPRSHMCPLPHLGFSDSAPKSALACWHLRCGNKHFLTSAHWGCCLHHSTPNMTGRRFHRTMEMIPALPW